MDTYEKDKWQLINKKTGEIVEYESDFGILSEKEIKNRRHFAKVNEEYELNGSKFKAIYKNYGNFIWFRYKPCELLDFGMSISNLTRLMYLATYMMYDNRLAFSNGVNITREHLPHIMKLGEMCAEQFLNELIRANILREEKDYIILNKRYFYRGDLKNLKNNNGNMKYTRLYICSIRELYESCQSIKEHKKLSYLFQMIPFLNITHNCLSDSVMETEIRKMSLMPFEKHCKTLKLSISNMYNIKKYLMSLKIDNIPVCDLFQIKSGTACYINPRLFYGGNQHDIVSARFDPEDLIIQEKKIQTKLKEISENAIY